MDNELFNKSLNRAAMLMNNERFNALVESKSRGGMGGSKKSGELSHLEAQAFGHFSHTPQPVMQTTSTLPSAIRESFSLNGGAQQNTQTVVAETQTYMPQTQPVLSQGVNYEIIKALIDESISRHLNEIKQSLLNENTNVLSGIKIGDGNKIVLMDKSKNVYDATLKKRTNKQ